MNELLFLSVWVLALITACAGFIAVIKSKGIRAPLAFVLRVALAFLVVMLLVGPVFLLFMASTDS